MRRIAVLLVALAVLAAPAPASAATRSVPPGFYGVTLDKDAGAGSTAQLRAQLRHMARSGVESVRTVFSWASMQADRGGPVDYGRTDALVAEAARAGVQLVPVVMYAPAWARAHPGVAAPPADMTAYASFVGGLVARYGRSGSFWRASRGLPRRPLRHWQLWNEPHLAWQWDASGRGGLAWPRGYVSLLRATRPAVRRADPHARVVLAGLTNRSWLELQTLYRAGARRLFDVAALHAYTGSAANVMTIVRLARRAMSRAGERSKPIWLTEVGWPAARGRVRAAPYHRSIVTTNRGMARRLTGLYARSARARRRLGIGRVFWYTWASDYRSRSIFDYSGLGSFRGGRFRARPALRAFARSARRHEGCAKTARGRCRR